ncbi:hypothetical protein [Acrocarpospora sp. B8E8]|uniref:hypothetical protein n=1 Tax=Acrocarpospora sp. B8E8 TaxID=3153572 RepID=UPI00325E5064
MKRPGWLTPKRAAGLWVAFWSACIPSDVFVCLLAASNDVAAAAYFFGAAAAGSLALLVVDLRHLIALHSQSGRAER